MGQPQFTLSPGGSRDLQTKFVQVLMIIETAQTIIKSIGRCVHVHSNCLQVLWCRFIQNPRQYYSYIAYYLILAHEIVTCMHEVAYYICMGHSSIYVQ